MSIFQKIRGTIESIFQLGLGGPQLKNNSGIIEARNSTDATYAVVRGAPPVGDNDFVTKLFLQSNATPCVVTAQFDGNNPLPANTGTEHYIVVTTTGANAAIGEIIYDNGSGSGTAVLLAASDGRMIFTTQAYSGGTISLQADSIYVWDSTTSSWLQEGSSQQTSGSVRCIKFAIGTSASYSSASDIPANATILSATVDVTTPYSGGATISVGRTGSTSLLQATTDNLPTAANLYKVEQNTAWGGSALPVLVTIGGTPGAGVGTVVVLYTQPNA